MDIKEAIQEILYLIITGIVPLLIAYIITWLKIKIKENKQKIDNEMLQKYIDEATNAISDAVLEVSQVYVDALKKQGKFDAEAQEIAKQMAVDKATTLINEQSKAAIELVYNDYTAYLNNQIEVLVRKNKEEDLYF